MRQTRPTVTIVGGQLLLNGEPFTIRGVNWNPVPKGKEHPSGLDYAGAAPTDIPLMAAAGINAVRTYEPLDDPAVLDTLANAGIYVFSTVYPWGGHDPSVVTDRVAAVRHHRAIMAYVLGNEWDLNGLYFDLPREAARDKLNEVAKLVHAADPDRPVATIWSDDVDGLRAMVPSMPLIDLWGVNAYRGDTFGNLFDEYRLVLPSVVPLFIGEYGVDAYDSGSAAVGLNRQADATRLLGQELGVAATAVQGGVAGGFVFEWADEWWKSGGPPDVHQPGSMLGSRFNEEWFGLVDIDRKTRPAYDVVKSLWGGKRE